MSTDEIARHQEVLIELRKLNKAQKAQADALSQIAAYMHDLSVAASVWTDRMDTAKAWRKATHSAAGEPLGFHCVRCGHVTASMLAKCPECGWTPRDGV